MQRESSDKTPHLLPVASYADHLTPNILDTRVYFSLAVTHRLNTDNHASESTAASQQQKGPRACLPRTDSKHNSACGLVGCAETKPSQTKERVELKRLNLALKKNLSEDDSCCTHNTSGMAQNEPGQCGKEEHGSFLKRLEESVHGDCWDVVGESGWFRGGGGHVIKDLKRRRVIEEESVWGTDTSNQILPTTTKTQHLAPGILPPRLLVSRASCS